MNCLIIVTVGLALYAGWIACLCLHDLYQHFCGHRFGGIGHRLAVLLKLNNKRR